LKNKRPKMICVIGNGCPENRIDAARLETFIENNGLELTNDWKDADVILFNACGRTGETQINSLKIIQEINSKRRSDQKLVVWGCLPKIDSESIKGVHDGVISQGSELVEFPSMINLQGTANEATANYLGQLWPLNKNNAPRHIRYEGSVLTRFTRGVALRWDSVFETRFNLIRDHNFYIKVSTGCQGACTYCAIKISRGLTKSKRVENVLAEFEKGLQMGYYNFSLMGTDLGSYGVDIGCTLVDLLREITNQPGNYMINLRNVNPFFLKNHLNDTLPILRSKKIRYMEVPAESGSNRILKLMNRRYSIEDFKEIIGNLRAAYPKIIIRTQLMVAFPTETEEDFQRTLKLLDDVYFDYIDVYKFSSRPNTTADKMEPKVPEAVAKQRFLKLFKKAVMKGSMRRLKKIVLNEF